MKKFCIVVLVLVVVGCSAFTRPSANIHDLGPVIAMEKSVTHLRSVQISAPDWLNDSRLIYRQLFIQPTVIKSYTLDRWVAPPGELLGRKFRFIYSARQLNLQISLLNFEQRFINENLAQSIITFDVEVYSRGKRDLLARRVFTYREENKTADAIGAINSFVELSDQAAADLSEWLNSLSDNHN